MIRRKINFSVSGVKHYENEYYKNSSSSFAALSVTGGSCCLGCAHCNGTILQSMHDVSGMEKFISRIDKLSDSGCTGVLVSGGSDLNGAVPLLPYIDGIARAKQRGLKVVVHTGLVDRETAYTLKSANVDQVLLDLIGSDKTIQDVYGIQKKTEDFLKSMGYCKDAGLCLAPHLVIGLDFGRIEGEYHAIDMARNAGVENFVLVVLSPKRGTKMQNVLPPPLDNVLKVFSYAANTLGDTNISLGCARPFEYSIDLEKAAIDLGFSAIAYPHGETIEYAKQLGVSFSFLEECCCLCK